MHGYGHDRLPIVGGRGGRMNQVDAGRVPFGSLPLRPGPQPCSSAVLPFRQTDQWPPAEIQGRLLEGCAAMTGVRMRESRMALPGVHALYLPDNLASAPPEAFIDGHEFCHLHPL